MTKTRALQRSGRLCGTSDPHARTQLDVFTVPTVQWIPQQALISFCFLLILEKPICGRCRTSFAVPLLWRPSKWTTHIKMKDSASLDDKSAANFLLGSKTTPDHPGSVLPNGNAVLHLCLFCGGEEGTPARNPPAELGCDHTSRHAAGERLSR